MIDWSKPIQFANGQRCELKRTRPEGWTQFGKPYPTREIQRFEDNGEPMEGMASRWFVQEDGSTGWPRDLGFYVVNVDRDR